MLRHQLEPIMSYKKDHHRYAYSFLHLSSSNTNNDSARTLVQKLNTFFDPGIHDHLSRSIYGQFDVLFSSSR